MKMKLPTLVLLTATSLLFATSARAELLRVEIKTLGMD